MWWADKDDNVIYIFHHVQTLQFVFAMDKISPAEVQNC